MEIAKATWTTTVSRSSLQLHITYLCYIIKVYLFFTAFLSQMPIVHAPTFRAEGKPLVLLGAMQACGALFVKNATAMAFIDETLALTRDTLIREFVSMRPSLIQLRR